MKMDGTARLTIMTHSNQRSLGVTNTPRHRLTTNSFTNQARTITQMSVARSASTKPVSRQKRLRYFLQNRTTSPLHLKRKKTMLQNRFVSILREDARGSTRTGGTSFNGSHLRGWPTNGGDWYRSFA